MRVANLSTRLFARAFVHRGCRHGLSLAFGAVLQRSRRARWCVQPASVCQGVATCAQLVWLAVQCVRRNAMMHDTESHTGPFVCSFANLPVTALAHTTPCHPSHSSRCPRSDATRVDSESGHAMCNATSQLLAGLSGVCEVIPCKPSATHV